jgi:hypothetical protein
MKTGWRINVFLIAGIIFAAIWVANEIWQICNPKVEPCIISYTYVFEKGDYDSKDLNEIFKFFNASVNQPVKPIGTMIGSISAKLRNDTVFFSQSPSKALVQVETRTTTGFMKFEGAAWGEIQPDYENLVKSMEHRIKAIEARDSLMGERLSRHQKMLDSLFHLPHHLYKVYGYPDVEIIDSMQRSTVIK